GLNGGVAVTVNTLVAGDDATAAAIKINAALAAATGGNDNIIVTAVGTQLSIDSGDGDVVTLAGSSPTLDAIGFLAANRVSAGTPPANVASAALSGGKLV